VNPSNAFPGDLLVFTLTVGNYGSIAAESVTVQDTLPNYLDILSVTETQGSTSIEGQTVIVVLGTVKPSDIITIQIRAQINDNNAPSVGYNTARISTTSSTDNPDNNTHTVAFTISPPGENKTPLPIPSELPLTGTSDDLGGNQLPFILIGMLLVTLGLLLRRRTH
jgi:uncharacterized repeat protein (TIGR01451 family)